MGRPAVWKTAAIAAAILTAGGAAQASKIVINEFYRSGTFATDEWVELVLLQDMTAAELNTYFVGDSTSTPNSKFSAYQFTGTGSIASTFKAGTIILAGGTTAVPTEDTTYDGGPDKVIKLQFSGSHLVKQGANSGDLAGVDVVWVDTAATGSTIAPEGFAVAYGTTAGTLRSAANVILSTVPANASAAALTADPSTGAATAANWSAPGVTYTGTPGVANGGSNSTGMAALPVSVSAFSLE